MLWQTLPVALALLFVAAMRSPGEQRIVVAGALLANWLANTLIAVVTGTQFAWPMLAAVDWVTALVILACQTGRWGVIIIASYVLQLVTHASFAVGPQNYDQRYAYWISLYAEAWLQAAIVLLWTLHDRAKVVRGAGDPEGGALAGDVGVDPVALREPGR